jgi:hypothetical protein
MWNVVSIVKVYTQNSQNKHFTINHHIILSLLLLLLLLVAVKRVLRLNPC